MYRFSLAYAIRTSTHSLGSYPYFARQQAQEVAGTMNHGVGLMGHAVWDGSDRQSYRERTCHGRGA